MLIIYMFDYSITGSFMQTFYLRKDVRDFTRKILVDMAFLNAHKIIRYPKYLFEDGLYVLFRDKEKKESLNKYFLEASQAKKEDKDFYYFTLPFKPNQVENI